MDRAFYSGETSIRCTLEARIFRRGHRMHTAAQKVLSHIAEIIITVKRIGEGGGKKGLNGASEVSEAKVDILRSGRLVGHIYVNNYVSLVIGIHHKNPISQQ